MPPADIRLPEALSAWIREGESPGFAAALKAELEALGASAMPLGALSSTGYVADQPVSVAVLATGAWEGQIGVVLGVHFEELLPGCSCGDEAEPRPAYGELGLRIDACTALARFAALPAPPSG